MSIRVMTVFAVDHVVADGKVLCAVATCLMLLTGWHSMPGSHLEVTWSLSPPPDVQDWATFLSNCLL